MFVEVSSAQSHCCDVIVVQLLTSTQQKNFKKWGAQGPLKVGGDDAKL